MTARILASDVTVGMVVRPVVPGGRALFGTVIEVGTGSYGVTTLQIKGYDRWDRQAVGVFQYARNKTIAVASKSVPS